MFSNFIGAEVAMIGGESLEYGEEYFGRVKNYVYSHTIPKTRVIVFRFEKRRRFGRA